MRGRRPDPPELQAAKGNPGRRKPRKAGSLPASDVAMPPHLRRASFKAAKRNWQRLAPQLIAENRLSITDVDAFARYCQYLAEWIELTEFLEKNGRTVDVPTVSGGTMPRNRPENGQRKEAADQLNTLEQNFGLNPAKRFELYRSMSNAKAAIGGLFAKTEQEDSEQRPPDDGADLIGIAAAHRPH